MHTAVESWDVVIVGGGQAAAETAFSLRQQGFPGQVLLISDESVLPYQRPPLSKQYLRGEVELDVLQLRSVHSYEQANIAVMLNTRVEQLRPAAKEVVLQDGRLVRYGKLVLATGGRARQLGVPGMHLQGVEVLRTVADVQAIRSRWSPGRSLVIVGGGYVGLEVAAAAVASGLKVTLLEQESRVLGRVTAPVISSFYQALHARHGVALVTGAQVDALIPADNGLEVRGVRLLDARTFPADQVIVGVGLVANVELAQLAGLATNNGIEVDESCRTADPDIYAAGDCANFPCGFFQRRMRLESVPNANEHARCIAANLCGTPRKLDAMPWFWSDQYGLKLQMAGLSSGHEHLVLRGDPEQGHFSAFYLLGSSVIGADCIARPADFIQARRLIMGRVSVSAEALADEAIALRSLV
ncbi:FAD-dependent oxidoreductase [Pseudomonas silvicola]|nr:FAD-dependent oxidoreductase [Pseudomonas silvicola]